MGELIDLRIWWLEVAFRFSHKQHADYDDYLAIGQFASEMELQSWKTDFISELAKLCQSGGIIFSVLQSEQSVHFRGDKFIVAPVIAKWFAEGYFYYIFDDRWVSCA